jgi:hypothetical protein
MQPLKAVNYSIESLQRSMEVIGSHNAHALLLKDINCVIEWLGHCNNQQTSSEQSGNRNDIRELNGKIIGYLHAYLGL